MIIVKFLLYLSQNTEINEEFTFWLQLEFWPVIYMSYFNRAFISHAATDPDLGDKTIHDTFIRLVRV